MANKPFIVIDIDGTISNANPRSQKYLRGEDGKDRKNKDWDSYFAACDTDEPIIPICNLVRNLSHFYNIIWCSGRRKSSLDKTLNWIEKYVFDFCAYYHPDEEYYLLRDDKDFRHDLEVKPQMLEKFIDKYNKSHKDPIKIEFFIEDRNSMVAKWRELGYTVLQPALGDF